MAKLTKLGWIFAGRTVPDHAETIKNSQVSARHIRMVQSGSEHNEFDGADDWRRGLLEDSAGVKALEDTRECFGGLEMKRSGEVCPTDEDIWSEDLEDIDIGGRVHHTRVVDSKLVYGGPAEAWMEGLLEDRNVNEKRSDVDQHQKGCQVNKKEEPDLPNYKRLKRWQNPAGNGKNLSNQDEWVQEYRDDWNIENEAVRRILCNCHSPKPITHEEKKAISIFHQDIRMEGQRYRVPLLWRNSDRPQNNFESAKRMFESYEKRLAGNGILRKEFFAALQDWIDRGYSKVVKVDPRAGFYLPTFMVVRLDKSTTKFRLIMNGAARFGKQSKSINDFLLTGPNLINGVFEVIAKYRRGRYTLSCDISQMFLNILTDINDHKYIQILVRRSPTDRWTVVQFNRHIFGLTQSPYVAIQTVLYYLHANRDKWPEVWSVFPERTVVDDFMFSTDAKEELFKLYSQIVPAFRTMGMDVHKWATNVTSLWKELPQKDRQKSLVLREEEDLQFCVDSDGTHVIKALGIVHDTATDVLQFFPPEVPDQEWTQRLFASFLGKIFDPLGLISPVMTTGKSIAQLMFRQGGTWDQEVSQEAKVAIEIWCRSLKYLPQLKIPRCLHNLKTRQLCEYLVCTDASSKAMAACVYQRELDFNGKCSSALVCSKQKMNPISKPESIPRVETEAANIGVKLACHLAKTYKLDLADFTFFTDSTTVLWYLRSRNALPIFTANRVCQILDYTELSQWNYINTKDNPADTPTRGMKPKQLEHNSLWWKGPSFFEIDRKLWPEQPRIFQTKEAEEQETSVREILNNLCFQTEALPKDFRIADEPLQKLVGRSRNIEKGIRIAAVVEGFIATMVRNNWRRGVQGPEINVGAMLETKREQLWSRLIRIDQEFTMPQLMKALRGKAKYQNVYLEYRPTIGRDGIVRCYGRLRNTPVYPKLTSHPDQLQRVLLLKFCSYKVQSLLVLYL